MHDLDVSGLHTLLSQNASWAKILPYSSMVKNAPGFIFPY